jgi:hypothetical protein
LPATSAALEGDEALSSAVLCHASLQDLCEPRRCLFDSIRYGLAPKLDVNNIVEFVALSDTLDGLRQDGFLPDPRAMCRAFYILRGIRGKDGVLWAGGALRVCPSLAADDVGPALLALHCAFKLHSNAQHGGCTTWAGHREGRHAGLSGSWFLGAVVTQAGRSAMECVTSIWLPYMLIILQTEAPVALDDSAVRAILYAAEGNFLLAIHKETEGGVKSN